MIIKLVKLGYIALFLVLAYFAYDYMNYLEHVKETHPVHKEVEVKKETGKEVSILPITESQIK